MSNEEIEDCVHKRKKVLLFKGCGVHVAMRYCSLCHPQYAMDLTVA